MISDAENLDKFIKAINRAAEKAVTKVRKETAAYVDSGLQQARELARQEITAAQFTELDKLTERNNADLSEAERQETQRLLQRRREIENEVFEEAQKRVAALVGSEQYKDFLTASAKKLRGLFKGNAVFYIRPEDEMYKSALRDICGEVQTDKSIVLGGIKAVSADGTLAADDTLDSRLAACRQAFYETSGLSVTL